jgi:hypothetical protein
LTVILGLLTVLLAFLTVLSTYAFQFFRQKCCFYAQNFTLFLAFFARAKLLKKQNNFGKLQVFTSA